MKSLVAKFGVLALLFAALLLIAGCTSYEEEDPVETCRAMEAGAPGTMDACLSGAARAHTDHTLCERVSDPAMRDGCYYGVSEVLSTHKCEKIVSTATRDACYFNAAKKWISDDHCWGIEDEDYKQECYGWVSDAEARVSS